MNIMLASRLSSSAHIKSAVSKTRKGIGLLKYLSKYLPRYALNDLYKLYVRPHLVYGDVIYHTPAKMSDFSQNIIVPNLMETIGVSSVFCYFGCNWNMEGNVSREVVHRAWLGVAEFQKVE